MAEQAVQVLQAVQAVQAEQAAQAVQLEVGGGEQLPTPAVNTPQSAPELKQEATAPVVAQASQEPTKEAEAPAQHDEAEQAVQAEQAAQAVQVEVGGGEQLPTPAVNTPQSSPELKQDVVAPVDDQVTQEPTKEDEASVQNNEVSKNVVAVQELPEKIEDPPAAILNSQSEKPLPDVSKNQSGVNQEDSTPHQEQSKEVEQSKESELIAPAAVTEASVSEENNSDVHKESGDGDWQKRESELLKKIEELEKVKNARSEDGLRLELKVREEEIDLLKARVKNLETELQAALSKPGGKNHEMIENIKLQHEELLSKARGMIFDKTKMVKNQELQIEALSTQVQSLKDINVITKDLLEIRNSEVKAMEERFQAMEARYKAEKERYELVLKRAQTSTTINDDLRKEYETQLAIFKELREKYEQRVQALVAENNRFKEALKGAGPSG